MESLREDALHVARDVGRRLADPRRLAEAIEQGGKQTSDQVHAFWHATSLAQGHPGLALTFAELETHFPNEGWGDAAHRQVELSVESLRADRRIGSGLFSGLAGLAFAVRSIDEVRYARLLDTLDGLLARHVEQIVARLDSRSGGVAESDFDVVSGLAGLGAYHLRPDTLDAVRPIVDRLIRLILADGDLPGWYTPHELLDEYSAPFYPQGRLNCGLAHGLSGPLALLSLAHSEGFEAEGLLEAIECASAWLVEQIVEDEWGVNWPYAVAIGSDAPPRPARTAWCYGAPGIARTLWLAGAARGDRPLKELAVERLEAVARRPAEAREVDAPTFCHGLAGLLQITLRMANDSGSDTVAAFADALLAAVVDRFEADSVLGYRDLDPEGRPVDRAGILEGAAGVALVLLAASNRTPPRWDRMFLLS